MNRTSYKNNKIFVFLILILLIGIITGILYSFKVNLDFKDNIANLIASKKILTINPYHLLFSLLCIITSFIFIGFTLSTFSIFLEGFSIGISSFYYIKYFQFKGFLFNIITIIFGKLVYIFLSFIIAINIIKLFKNIVSNNKNETYFKNMYRLIVRLLFSFFTIFLNEIVISLLFNKIALYFSFLIK